ncbi:FecR family protein [Hymenobacter weizhouensis]|uniref:FecR family protein n=1 Tax=Hymenobacter sp. YIM 151500-1 TaxID=2987689 RepID=UPI0022279DB5|nr:FecR domain-containing protein [Hymenobacter sp. YIM 151500-1]UYZ62399.1 FecR domain-containing protein [Hymenobacter sp. YIM 151500-1]
MLETDYSRYTPEDFALDESFQAFVFDEATAEADFWRQWLALHPHKADDCQAARDLLRLLTPNQRALAPDEKQQELRKLLRAIRTPLAHQPPAVRWRGYRRARLVQVAAGLVLLVLAGLGGWLWQRNLLHAPATEYATGYGQQRQLTLPDGSTVVLNANSTLRTTSWNEGGPREVWLSGEAYFHVARKAPASAPSIAGAAAPAKFVVHAGTLDVTVLGTQFNVVNRRGQTKVVLTSGKVQVDLRAGQQPHRVLMRPGQLVESSAARPQLHSRAVNPALYSSWTQGHLSFDGQTLAEVVQVLEESYGLQVEVTDPALLRQRITGSVPNANVEEFLDALSKTLDVRVTRTGQRVRLEPAQ